jgi:hypothetical protein
LRIKERLEGFVSWKRVNAPVREGISRRDQKVRVRSLAALLSTIATKNGSFANELHS